MASERRGVNALVLAGGPPDDVAALAPGLPNKAFLTIDGVPLVTRTLRALRAAAPIERIVTVAPVDAHADPALALADERRPDGPRMLDSLAAGMQGFPADELLLVVASDLPILSAAAIEEFVALAHSRDCDIGYAILPRALHAARFPQVPHTWARLREGQFCAGGLVALRPRAFERLRPFLDALGAARKSPLRLAALFGWEVLLRFAVGALRIADAERRACSVLGVPVAAIRSTHPEIAVNVDRPSDVPLANELVRAAAKQGE